MNGKTARVLRKFWTQKDQEQGYIVSKRTGQIRSPKGIFRKAKRSFNGLPGKVKGNILEAMRRGTE